MRAICWGVALMLILGLSGPDSLSFAEGGPPQITDKNTTAENKNDTEQPNQNINTGKDIKEIPDVKSENGSSPKGEKELQKTTATDSQKEVKAVDSKKSSKADIGLKKAIPTAEDDRPWLMKERSTKKSDTPPKKPVPLKWKDDAQQVQCKTQLKKLHKALDKARIYSTRGDTCATAKHADDFLVLTGRLRTECPDRFLESNGYSEKIIENLKVLSELGKKACLEK